jgi:hypothetical protein
LAASTLVFFKSCTVNGRSSGLTTRVLTLEEAVDGAVGRLSPRGSGGEGEGGEEKRGEHRGNESRRDVVKRVTTDKATRWGEDKVARRGERKRTEMKKKVWVKECRWVSLRERGRGKR